MAKRAAGYFDNLYRYTVEREVTLHDGSLVTVVVKQIGAQKSGARENLARAEARDSLRRFRDETSDAYDSLNDFLDQQGEEGLSKIVEFDVKRKLAEEALREWYHNTNNDDDEPPSDNMTESLERDESAEEKDAYVHKMRMQYIDDNLPSRLEVYKRDPERLRSKAWDVMVDQGVSAAYTQAFMDATLLYGVFKQDGETPFFDELPIDTPQLLKDKLHLVYREVDQPTYDPSS